MKTKAPKVVKQTLDRTKDALFVTKKQKDNRVNTGSPFTKKDARVRK